MIWIVMALAVTVLVLLGQCRRLALAARGVGVTREVDGFRVQIRDEHERAPALDVKLFDEKGRAHDWIVDARYAHRLSDDLICKSAAALRPKEREDAASAREAVLG